MATYINCSTHPGVFPKWNSTFFALSFFIEGTTEKVYKFYTPVS